MCETRELTEHGEQITTGGNVLRYLINTKTQNQIRGIEKNLKLHRSGCARVFFTTNTCKQRKYYLRFHSYWWLLFCIFLKTVFSFVLIKVFSLCSADIGLLQLLCFSRCSRKELRVCVCVVSTGSASDLLLQEPWEGREVPPQLSVCTFRFRFCQT